MTATHRLVAAALLSVFAATAAEARDFRFPPNRAEIAQQGALNGAAVAQYGRGLDAAVDQAGLANTASVRQFGTNISGEIVQRGANNSACLVQFGRDVDASVTQVGVGQRIGVLQMGDRVRQIPVEVCPGVTPPRFAGLSIPTARGTNRMEQQLALAARAQR